ncbi:hypothetical protein ACJJTC_006877 [Scirpophaga incertulas]
MDRFLRPERFDGDPTVSSSAPAWEHWKRTFENFVIAYEAASIPAAAQPSQQTTISDITDSEPQTSTAGDNIQSYQDLTTQLQPQVIISPDPEALRRSTRKRNPPLYLRDYSSSLTCD